MEENSLLDIIDAGVVPQRRNVVPIHRSQSTVETSLNPKTPFLSRPRSASAGSFPQAMCSHCKPARAPMNCSTQQKELSLGKSLLGTIFIFSRFYNVLIELGCKNVVTLLANETTAGVCMAVCRSSGYTPTDTSCNGVDCCKTNIPQLLQEQQIIYRSSDTNTRFCGYAFLVLEIWLLNDYKKYKVLQDNLSNPFDNEFVLAPMALDWEFPPADFELGICRNRPYYSSDGRTKLLGEEFKANRKQKFFKRNGGLLLDQQLSSTQNGVERTKVFSSNE
ncbi:Uncharacterized protein Fot_15303 [Forsythia ovata]|uniref:Uncharacterized protein n=1 Tax=Forsythia ovata TaxID=205694 RepID=A0ABD1W9A4_9LAMI